MKSYPLYKNSGVEWIGKIPTNWDILKYRRLSTFKNGMNFSAQDKGQGILTLDVLNMYDGDSLYIKDFELYRVNKVDISDYILKEGDLLFVRSSLKREGVGWCALFKPQNEKVSFCGFIIRARPTNLLFKPKFAAYYFRSNSGRNEVIENSNTVTITNIGQTSLGEVKIPLPPLPEQKQIVSFLDHKTQKIDELVEKTEKKIELLKEKRTSLINHCVTKGLNPNVEMKDSGVEWIGEIPSYWRISKLKYFSNITLGKMLTPQDKGGYQLKPYLRSQNIQVDSVDINDVKEMWFSEDELVKYILRKEDLLVNEGGDVGRTCMWMDELGECFIQNSVNRVDITNGNKKFYLYHFYLHHQSDYFDSIVNRVSIPHLTKEKLENVLFIRPPLTEQQQIVEYLDEHIQKIDSSIEKEIQREDLLKEYRQSLISEVVTGKIDVRDEVVV